VGPEVTQCIKSVSAQEVQLFLEPLNAMEKEFIFFAVNDNTQALAVGGSHWNLVVYSKPENTFYNFDSIGDKNYYPTKKLVEILKKSLKCENAKFKEGESLSQTNGYDCGIHLICTVDQVTHHICKSRKIEGVKKVSPGVIFTKRSEILQIIRDLGGIVD
jgi:sentrin-specific protease 8